MYEGPILDGARYIWAPDDPRAFERIAVTQIGVKNGIGYVETTDRAGLRYWNREESFRKFCVPQQKKKTIPKSQRFTASSG